MYALVFLSNLAWADASRLADDQFWVREAAHQRLAWLGEVALPALNLTIVGSKELSR